MVAQLALPSLYFFSGICVSKMKEKIFAEMKPQTCRWHVFTNDKKANRISKLNSNHSNIKLTIQKNSAKFLDV